MELDGELRHVRRARRPSRWSACPPRRCSGGPPVRPGCRPEVVVPLETAPARGRRRAARSASSSWRCPPPRACGGCTCAWCRRTRAAGGPVARGAAGDRHHRPQARRAAAQRGQRRLPRAGRGLARPDRPDRRDLQIVFVNAALERATGREAGTLHRPRRRRGWGCPPRRPSRLEQAVGAAFATGERLAIDFGVPDAEGPRWLTGRAAARARRGPRPRGALVHRRHRAGEPGGRAGGPAPRRDGGGPRGRPGGDRAGRGPGGGDPARRRRERGLPLPVGASRRPASRPTRPPRRARAVPE